MLKKKARVLVTNVKNGKNGNHQGKQVNLEKNKAILPSQESTKGARNEYDFSMVLENLKK